MLHVSGGVSNIDFFSGQKPPVPAKNMSSKRVSWDIFTRLEERIRQAESERRRLYSFR